MESLPGHQKIILTICVSADLSTSTNESRKNNKKTTKGISTNLAVLFV